MKLYGENTSEVIERLYAKVAEVKGARVVFEVDTRATKTEIKQAVEKVFSVKVEGVRTVHVRGKKARMGRFTGRKRSWKKAYVTLSEGDQIEFFEGV